MPASMAALLPVAAVMGLTGGMVWRSAAAGIREINRRGWCGPTAEPALGNLRVASYRQPEDKKNCVCRIYLETAPSIRSV